MLFPTVISATGLQYITLVYSHFHTELFNKFATDTHGASGISLHDLYETHQLLLNTKIKWQWQVLSK